MSDSVTRATNDPRRHAAVLDADSSRIGQLAAILRVYSVKETAAALDGAVDLGGDRRLRKAANELRRKSWGRSTINDNDALSEMEGYLISGAARSIWRAAGLAAATRFGKQTFLSVQKRLDEKFREKFPGKYLNTMNQHAK